MSPGTTKPALIALVLCDNVYYESGGKQALVGLFNTIHVHSLPTVIPRISIFASLTDARPDTQCRIEILHSESEEVVFQIQGPIPDTPAGPMTVHDMVFLLNGVPFQKPGRHEVRVWGNDYPLGIRPFFVELPPEPAKEINS